MIGYNTVIKRSPSYRIYEGLAAERIVRGEELLLFNADGVVLAHLNARCAPQTLIHVHRHGLPILQDKDLHGANVDAFAVAGALVLVYRNDPGHAQTRFLVFFQRDGVLFADLNAGLALQALVLVDDNGLVVLHLEDLGRAGIDAFAAAHAFFLIDDDLRHNIPPRLV
jgi:hypothetical protein